MRLVILLATLAVCSVPAPAQQTAPLRAEQTIALPDVQGRIDHMAVDVQRQRLFVAALGNNTLEVVDLRGGRRVGTIRDLHKPQGVFFVPDINRIFVANGQDGACDMFDGDTFRLLKAIGFADDADNVRYDAVARRIYVGYGRGALGILNASDGRQLGNIKLAGHPESFELETSGPRVFVNVPTAGHIAVVDREKRTLLATWPLVGAQSNFPMALDEAGRRVFVGCRRPSRVLVYDTSSGREVVGLDIAGDTDDLFYDAARKRLYVSCGEGFIDVFQQRDADHYTRIARMPTAAGARTSFFVPHLGRLYLAVPHRGAQRAEIRVYEAQP